MMYILAFIVGFLSGSIPFGYIISRIKGVDIREIGSGNIGATNVARALGKKYFFVVFFLDGLKGFLPALVFLNLCSIDCGVIAGISAILGHMFTPWLGFRGGKGVATGFGVFLALAPKAVAVGFLVWFIVLLTIQIMALASITGAIAAFIATLYFCNALSIKLMAGFAALMVIIRHRDNIKRMLREQEPRFRLFGR